MLRETFDGMTITEYLARFTGTFDVDPEFAEGLHTGKVTVWLVAASTEKTQIDSHQDAGEATRKNIQKIETAIPLAGELRDQAIVFLSYEGVQGHVGFIREGRSQDTEAMDRLGNYLVQNYAEQMRDDESAVDLTIRLLDTPVDRNTGEVMGEVVKGTIVEVDEEAEALAAVTEAAVERQADDVNLEEDQDDPQLPGLRVEPFNADAEPDLGVEEVIRMPLQPGRVGSAGDEIAKMFAGRS